MDELVIDDKKYISTKRAAKMTGYAKDYVGQLCREGRVPARLVGRSWYVLESALQDHRFGDKADASEEQAEKAPESVPGTWESPKYEPVPVHELPTVNRLVEAPSTPIGGEETTEAPLNGLQDAWREWFATQDRAPAREETELEDQKNEPEESYEAAIETFESEELPASEEKEPITVPIHAIHQELQVPVPKTVAPAAPYMPIEREVTQRVAPEAPVRRTSTRGFAGRAIAFMSVLIMLAAVGAALLSSGYMDSYAISNATAGAVAGVALYKR